MIIPIEGIVDVVMIIIKSYVEKVYKDVEEEEQLDEDQHGPVHRDHIERVFKHHHGRGQRRQQDPGSFIIVTADVEKKLFRAVHCCEE